MNINSRAFAQPKLTKKQRKRASGMNHATKIALSQGYKPPQYRNIAPIGQPVQYAKVESGTPHVNADNFR